jgi:hypothetical protein
MNRDELLRQRRGIIDNDLEQEQQIQQQIQEQRIQQQIQEQQIQQQIQEQQIQQQIQEQQIRQQQADMALVFHISYLQSVPEFDGEPHKLSEYIRAAEVIIAQFGQQADAFLSSLILSSLRTKLVGRACVVTSGREINSWIELKNILQQTFADQRSEDSLLRDLMLLRQTNESPQEYYEKCQVTKSLLFSRLRITENDANVRQTKQNMYDSLTLKAFLSGLKEPLGATIRSRSPASIEIALSHIIDEENVAYTRGQHNSLFKNPLHLNKQKHSQMPSYNAFQRPSTWTPSPARPALAWTPTQNKPMFQQPRTPQFHQPQRPMFQRQYPPIQPFNKPPSGAFKNTYPQRNVWQPQNRPQPRAMPMDTSSRNTRPIHQQMSTQQPRRNFISEELFYHEDVEPEEYEDCYDQDNATYEEDYDVEEPTDPQDFPPGTTTQSKT